MQPKTARKARAKARQEQELLIAYLRYALEDVRPVSARSADLLAGAIAVLAEDAMKNAGTGGKPAVKHDIRMH